MNVYPVKIDWKGKETVISLKLDLRHIRELHAATGIDILDLLTDAPLTLAPMGDLLEAALHWKGNDNPADLTGEDLFDILVQHGKAGPADWMEIVTGIASASGILQGKQAAAMLSNVRRRMEASIQQLEQEGSEEDSDNPPKGE